MEQPDKPILDYGQQQPLRRRDSLEYYREPPPVANLSLGYVLVWVIGFVVVGFLIVAGLVRFLSHPPL